MKIIISPAKKMKTSELDIPHQGYPLFVESGAEENSTFLQGGLNLSGKPECLLQYLKSLSLGLSTGVFTESSSDSFRLLWRGKAPRWSGSLSFGNAGKGEDWYF